LTNRPLLIFAACVTVFQLANGAMLPLMASVVTIAFERMDDEIGGGLYRGPATRRRGILARGRASGAAMGTPARSCSSASPHYPFAAWCSWS
jgi:hypothetical protein